MSNITMLDILPMRADWLREALVLGFVSLGSDERKSRSEMLLQQFAAGKISLEGIFAAKYDGKIVGVIFSQKRDDETILIWPPGTVWEITESGGVEPELAKIVRFALWDRMNEYIERNRIPIAIVFVEKIENVDESELENAGFNYLSKLQYLVAGESTFPMYVGRNSVEFVPFANESDPAAIDPVRFYEMVSLVDRTYVETRDFPLLSGISPTAEILHGYQYVGSFRPDLWFFVQIEGKNVGVLILTEQDDGIQLELTYMGLVPESRGKRLSGQIVQYTLWKARQMGRRMVVVSVDAQNESAVKAYKRNGFQSWDDKYLYVRIKEQGT